jgi:hypothetical protein
MDPITPPGPIKQTAILLFYGWGYNFYRVENQLRADDLLIRSKIGAILGAARAHIKNLENAYRRDFLPAPSRENPMPPREKIDQARRIERCGGLIETVMTDIQNAAAPAQDKIWERHRQEKELLETLQAIDIHMTDAALAFHDRLIDWRAEDAANPAIDNTVTAALEPLRIIARERAERLTLMV